MTIKYSPSGFAPLPPLDAVHIEGQVMRHYTLSEIFAALASHFGYDSQGKELRAPLPEDASEPPYIFNSYFEDVGGTKWHDLLVTTGPDNKTWVMVERPPRERKTQQMGE